MVTSEERMRVLRMVEEGVVTAEEGARLIQAMTGTAADARPEGHAADARWLRVLVTDVASGRERVNLRVPARLVDLALRFGARFTPEDGPDLEELMDAVHVGATGKVLDVVDDGQRQRVEVFLE